MINLRSYDDWRAEQLEDPEFVAELEKLKRADRMQSFIKKVVIGTLLLLVVLAAAVLICRGAARLQEWLSNCDFDEPIGNG